MNKTDLPFLSILELSNLMARKEVSPVEATEAYLERIESIDSRLNAYVTVTAEHHRALRDGDTVFLQHRHGVDDGRHA